MCVCVCVSCVYTVFHIVVQSGLWACMFTFSVSFCVGSHFVPVSVNEFWADEGSQFSTAELQPSFLIPHSELVALHLHVFVNTSI